MNYKNTRDKICVFVNDVVFKKVGLYWLIKSEKHSAYNFDQECSNWVDNGSWYGVTVFIKLCTVVFESFYVTTKKYRYGLICMYGAYENEYDQISGSISSG